MKIIDKATVSIEASWTEPTVNADGSPLLDLAYSSVYYQVGNGPVVVGAKLPATKPTGGGAVSTTLIIPAAAGAITLLTFTASETDLDGNESPKTSPVVFKVERVAPAEPVSFSVA